MQKEEGRNRFKSASKSGACGGDAMAGSLPRKQVSGFEKARAAEISRAGCCTLDTTPRHQSYVRNIPQGTSSSNFLTRIKVAASVPRYLCGMNKCVETMMQEHELIVEVLASLQAMAEKLDGGGSAARQDVADFGRFFRDFADKCHHGKEEDRLFVKMVEAGFPQDSGPIAVMLAEHDAGRAEVRGLLAIGAGSGPLSEAERTRTIEYASQLVPLLYAHIQKENNILYPMAQNSIPPEEFVLLDQSCQAFDREIQKQLDVAGLKDLAAGLLRRYPADAAQLAVYGGRGACPSGA
jgi:hemerythrin-like domain-containing protein